jgi:Ca2+-binding RTX toxin-like protein
VRFSVPFDFSAFRFYRMQRNWPSREVPFSNPYLWGPLDILRGNSILDVNGDGLGDIVLFPSYGTAGPHVRPIILMNDGRGGWQRREIAIPNFLPEVVNGLAAFSWKGSRYLVMADSGWEINGDPNLFEGSKIWLVRYDQATGTFVDETGLIPGNRKNYNHVSWWGDLDGNGRFDLLVPVMGNGNNKVAGHGIRWIEFGDTVVDRSSELPALVAYLPYIGNQPRPNLGPGGVGVGDLNGDGYNELLALSYKTEGPGTLPNIRIYYGGLQGFTTPPLVIPPSDAIARNIFGSPLGAFQSLVLDIAGDGDKALDLLVFWEEAGLTYIQALIQENGNFVDRTNAVLGSLSVRNVNLPDSNNRFITPVASAEVVDVNGDGRPDVYLRIHTSSPIDAVPQQSMFWVNDGAGHFVAGQIARPVDLPYAQQIVDGTSWETWYRGYMMYGDVTGDGVADLVSMIRGEENTIEANGNFYARYYDFITLPGIAQPGLVLTGSGRGEALLGGAGNDFLNGQAGNDRLRGAAGKDTLDGGAGSDTADFSDRTGGLTVVLAGATRVNARIDGRNEDTLVSIENVDGTAGADAITGDGLANRLAGGAGDDRLRGEGGDDVLQGGAGRDILDGGAGSDTADYGDKTQAVSVTLAGAANARVKVDGIVEDTIRNIENVIGGAGNDVLSGDNLGNRLSGGAGDDVLKGGGGKDTLDGGAGKDSADYGDKTQAISIILAGAADAAVKVNGVVEDTIRKIENVTGGKGDDSLTGDALANLLKGGAGHDILKGGGGKDTLDGGAGKDSADYGDKTQAVSVRLAGAADAAVKVNGIVEDTIRKIENVTGGKGDDSLTGDTLANLLAGGAGDDILKGGAGKDTLDGGAGKDTADYGDKTQAVSVVLDGAANAKVRVDGIVEDTIRNIENVIGGAGNDVLTGDALANVLKGGAGHDVLKGGGGKDTLDGGAGKDTADYGEKTQSVSVILAGAADARVKVDGLVEDTIRNVENVIGGSGNDVLAGDGVANRLDGGGGDDRLSGGQGRDVMIGGAGIDTFVFKAGDSAASLYDAIADFVTGVDRIDLPTVGSKGLPAARFGATSVASNDFTRIFNAAAAAMAEGDKSVVFVAGSKNGWLFWNRDADSPVPDEAVRLDGLDTTSAFQRTDLM